MIYEDHVTLMEAHFHHIYKNIICIVIMSQNDKKKS